jgi:hypothetical protein
MGGLGKSCHFDSSLKNAEFDLLLSGLTAWILPSAIISDSSCTQAAISLLGERGSGSVGWGSQMLSSGWGRGIFPSCRAWVEKQTIVRSAKLAFA